MFEGVPLLFSSFHFPFFLLFLFPSIWLASLIFSFLACSFFHAIRTSSDSTILIVLFSHVLTNQLSGKKPWFVASAHFCGINIPTVVDFKLTNVMSLNVELGRIEDRWCLWARTSQCQHTIGLVTPVQPSGGFIFTYPLLCHRGKNCVVGLLAAIFMDNFLMSTSRISQILYSLIVCGGQVAKFLSMSHYFNWIWMLEPKKIKTFS